MIQRRAFLQSSFLCLLLALATTACDNDNPPPLIREYASAWEVSVGNPEIYPLEWYYTYGIRLLPDSTILAFGNGLTNGKNFTRFIKMDMEGKVITKTTFYSYSGSPIISADGTITSLSDSLRRFDINLALLSKQKRSIDKIGLLAFSEESMIYTDYASMPVALAAYGHDGSLLWKKPASSLGCGGSYMVIEVLGNVAGMVTRSVGPQLDTLRLSAFELAGGKPVWIQQFLSDKVFGSSQLSTQTNWAADGSSVLLMGSDNLNSRIHCATVNSRGIRGNFTADLTSNPFHSLVRGMRTRDAGYLFGLNGNNQTDYFTYRLAKADRTGKVGWVGTFTFTGNDYLMDMLELTDGTILAVTGLGNLTAYRPLY